MFKPYKRQTCTKFKKRGYLCKLKYNSTNQSQSNSFDRLHLFGEDSGFASLNMLEGGNPSARHHGKGLERATFCHGVELSYCLITVRALTQTWYQECEQTLIILLLSICYRSDFL